MQAESHQLAHCKGGDIPASWPCSSSASAGTRKQALAQGWHWVISSASASQAFFFRGSLRQKKNTEPTGLRSNFLRVNSAKYIAVCLLFLSDAIFLLNLALWSAPCSIVLCLALFSRLSRAMNNSQVPMRFSFFASLHQGPDTHGRHARNPQRQKEPRQIHGRLTAQFLPSSFSHWQACACAEKRRRSWAIVPSLLPS